MDRDMVGLQKTVPDEKQVMLWIASKQTNDQEQATREHFQELLESASQPRHASGNACVKLCYFLEQCRKSTSAIQRAVAFSHATCLGLFNFYVEWNEKNQHRSMRQVLELLISLITLNPDKEASSIVRVEILDQVLSIINHQSAQSLVKPSLKVLECFMSKDAISIKDLIAFYDSSSLRNSTNLKCSVQKFEDSNFWQSFIYAILEWISLPDTSPAAGKLLVTLLRKLRAASVESLWSNDESYTMLWQKWIRHCLMRHPDCLENIKNYLFPSLFKLDRIGSLQFLEDLTQESKVQVLKTQELDAQALLLLSAMEVGKKSGLIDEPNVLLNKSSTRLRNYIILPEHRIGRLLSHRAGSVRSAAFSVLVSSMSSIRPFSSTTFSLLRQNLGSLHADTDAKVRNEVLSNIRHMARRVKGALSFLTKEIVSSHVTNNPNLPVELDHSDFPRMVMLVLQEHDDFIIWYQNFLLDELTPTAAYQRHITALKAIQIVLDCGIVLPYQKMSLDDQDGAKVQDYSSRKPFTEKMLRLLLDLVMNPFEDVRAAATQLLKLAPQLDLMLQNDMRDSNYRHFQEPSLFYEDIFKNSTDELWDRRPKDPDQEVQLRQTKVPEILVSFIQKAESGSRKTGRADMADGVARTHELIYSLQQSNEARLNLLKTLISHLEMKVLIAENDLAQAVLSAPIHEHFSAVRLVWELFGQAQNAITQPKHLTVIPEATCIKNLEKHSAWFDLQSRMLGCCVRIWAAVKEILCNDSPEGHLLQDLDDIDALDTKDILSYSFRAIHESSNLLRVMVNMLKLKSEDESAMVPFEIFRVAGNLSFEQLSNLRHRGAFSTVSSTFARCCQLTQEGFYEGHPGSSLLKEWYQGALRCIFEQSSTTRRSAGIPSLMTGILSANSKSPSLEHVMLRLKTMASRPALCNTKDETNLPQVHAMNCLKEIFKSSSLGKRCDNHITDSLQIAAMSLKSKTWAIRNCGLLLLRSLIDCLFGTSESRSVTDAGWDGRSTRIAYERYPALPEMLLDLMATDSNETIDHNSPRIGAVESVFPALDIIRRAGPPERFRTMIYSRIEVHLGSKIWHIRDIAARTICTLLLGDNWIEELSGLLNTCGNSTNQIHGVLLATRYLLERQIELDLFKASEGLEILTLRLDHFWATKPDWMLNPMNKAAYIEATVTLLKIAHITKRKLSTTISAEFSQWSSMLLQAGQISWEGRDPAGAVQLLFVDKSSTLLTRAVAIHALYKAAATNRIDQLHELIESAIAYDVDVACDILDHIAVLWNVMNSEAGDHARVLDICISAYSANKSDRMRTVALRNLADILEHLFQSGPQWRAYVTYQKFRNIAFSSSVGGSPDLSNAEIRFTGSLSALDFLHHSQQDKANEASGRIHEWGIMLSDLGRCENDFDTRNAAVAALNAFYCACSVEIIPSQQASCLIPSLLALYDTLNDDNDEIRDAGASVVSKILGLHQAPLPTSAHLLQWLYQNFGESHVFRAAVMDRVTNSSSEDGGMLEPVERQLGIAMFDDDALFAEEEQNLYADKVREAIGWTSLLAISKSTFSDDEISQLSSWASEGLFALASLAEREDGPFGWCSKPRVFAICMQIILTAKAIIARYKRTPGTDMTKRDGSDKQDVGKPLRDAVHCLLEVGRRNNLHPVLLDKLANSDALSA